MRQLLLISFLFLSVGISAQQSISLSNLISPPSIDGAIEAGWEQVPVISSFTQLEPVRGVSSTRKTELRIAQDDKHIYLFFECYLNNPGELAARIQRRDQLDESDDIISVVLDTYNDNRTALLFQVNAIGTLADAKISDDGKSVDYLWDTEWEAKTSIEEYSWTVEIAIPFKSIQYSPDQSSWGCNFSRSIRANQEIAWWSPLSESYRVSQSGELKDVEISKLRKHGLELFPYGTLRYQNASELANGPKVQPDAGLDLQYNYSTNLKANIALNPDFATVEGDKEQINLTPWELKFPEKRLFFQDGNEMFRTRINTFYSRRIGDVQYGGKVTGKINKVQFNGLFAQTRADQDLQVSAAKYSAFRIKRDFLESSTLGFSYTDKITDTLTFHTLSFDYVLNLGKTWKLTGQYVGSVPGKLNTHSGWFVRFARENNTYHYHVRFTSLGENFQDIVNETGYIPDDDRLEVDSDVLYKFWFDKTLNYLRLSGRNNMFWSQEKVLRSWNFTYGARAYSNSNLSLDLNYNNEYKLLDQEYHNHYYQAIAGYKTDEASRASLSYRTGRNFARDFDLLEFNTSFQLFKKLTLSYELKYLSFFPDETSGSTFLNVLGMDYYFTNDLWLHVFAQHNAQNDRVYFYGSFGWRFKPPFGAVYLIFNSEDYYDFNMEMPHHSRILFLKLTYPLTVI